ncbi:YfdQ family protein [Marinobacter adhaerens]|uniref:DUF2303 family protein n=1 Tax=Marinobacter adhaerens TaxID=1033846 RepID=UPI001C60468E|nr:DUF2303 family protein [Marinobacter adhaerens]MBW4978303.1 YfdQ family protein [Marinobacter adhaerens]
MSLEKELNNTLATVLRNIQAETIQHFIQAQTDGTVAALPVGVSVTDLEEYLQERRRYRGSMATNLIEEFVEYVTATTEAYGDLPGMSAYPCFVSPATMSAQTYFNLGDIENPGHGDHFAELKLKKTEAYKQLLETNGRKFDQQNLAEWLEDWKDHLEAIAEDGTTTVPMAAAVSAVRRITIGTNAEATSETHTLSNRRSAMAEVEARNKDQFPCFLKFTCEPYQGLEERTFTLRLSLITSEKPVIIPRIVRLETAEEEMAQELEEKLRSGFEDTPVKTFVGSFNPGK